MCVEAQILRVADEIEKILSETATRGRIGPKEAVKEVLQSNIDRPGSAMVAPDLAKRILSLLS